MLSRYASKPTKSFSTAQAKARLPASGLGTLLAMKHQLCAMSAPRSGSIVNVSSTMAARGAAGASLYVASKHAVEGLTKSAALEAASSGVRVNAVAPGPVQTPMLDRLAQTSERKAAFLDTVPLKRVGTPRCNRRSHRVRGVGQLHDRRSAACERRSGGIVSHASMPCLSGMAHNL